MRGRARNRGLPVSSTDPLTEPPRAPGLPCALALQPPWANPAGCTRFVCAWPPFMGAPKLRAAPALGGWRMIQPKSSQTNRLTMAAPGTERGPPSSGAPRKKGRRLRAPTSDAPPTPPCLCALGFYLATCWWEAVGPELGNHRRTRTVS